ncbi:MAG: hypothetical protein ACO3XO_09910, partial [Bdellovibrionota bacterium]
MNSPTLGKTREEIAICLNQLVLRRTQEAQEFSKTCLDPLLDTPRFSTPRGRPSQRIAALQDEVLGFIKARYTPSALDLPLKAYDSFLTFAGRMCIVGARFAELDARAFQRNSQKTELFVEHLIAHFQLLHEAGVANSILRTRAHNFSVFESGKILFEAEKIFGGDPDSAQLVKTAAVLVFQKQYQS